MEAFEPDLFSVERPKWNEVSDTTSFQLKVILELWRPGQTFIEKPAQIGALEINSSNFKISLQSGTFLLKRWPSGQPSEKVANQLKLLGWLSSNGIAVAQPIQDSLIKYKDEVWAAFEFIDGDYFKGAKHEVETISCQVGSLFKQLGQLPSKLSPCSAPQHLTADDDLIFRTFQNKKSEWPQILGGTHAQSMSKNWEKVWSDWNELMNSKPNPGPIQTAHFDLHPHNILMKDGQVAAILDFDACGAMPIGYALGFSVLKLMRQAKVHQGSQVLAADLGKIFIQNLLRTYPEIADFSQHLGQLAKAEVLRRIALILRLNLEQNPRWNHVLEIQLRHLNECDAIFKT